MDLASYGAEQQEEEEILASGARKSILANGEDAYAGVVDEEPITMSEEQAYKSVTAGNLLE